MTRTAALSRYNEFGSRDEFVQALVIREGRRCLDAVEEAIGEHADDPLAALTAALAQFLTIARDDPFVRLLLPDDGTAGLLPLLTTQSRPILEWAGRRLIEAIDAHWPGVRRGPRSPRRHPRPARHQPRRRAAGLAG